MHILSIRATFNECWSFLFVLGGLALKNLLILAASLLLCVASFGAGAEGEQKRDAVLWGYDPDWLIFQNTEIIDVKLDDQVDDGCWTDLSGTKNAVKLQLIRSGYETQDEEDHSIFVSDVTISAMGFGIPSIGGCVVALELTVSVPDYGEYAIDENVLSSLYTKPVISYRGVLTAKKANSNAAIKSQFEGFVQQFLVDISRSKQLMRGDLEEQEQDAGTKFWIDQLK